MMYRRETVLRSPSSSLRSRRRQFSGTSYNNNFVAPDSPIPSPKFQRHASPGPVAAGSAPGSSGPVGSPVPRRHAPDGGAGVSLINVPGSPRRGQRHPAAAGAPGQSRPGSAAAMHGKLQLATNWLLTKAFAAMHSAPKQCLIRCVNSIAQCASRRLAKASFAARQKSRVAESWRCEIRATMNGRAELSPPARPLAALRPAGRIPRKRLLACLLPLTRAGGKVTRRRPRAAEREREERERERERERESGLGRLSAGKPIAV